MPDFMQRLFRFLPECSFERPCLAYIGWYQGLFHVADSSVFWRAQHPCFANEMADGRFGSGRPRSLPGQRPLYCARSSSSSAATASGQTALILLSATVSTDRSYRDLPARPPYSTHSYVNPNGCSLVCGYYRSTRCSPTLQPRIHYFRLELSRPG